jgi:ribosomal protein S18 acetylase RimI-like enzyme
MLMLDYLKIQTSNSKWHRYFIYQIVVSLTQAAYVLLVNMRYLGKPSEENLSFLLSSYQQIFHEKLSRYHSWFYYLFGKNLIHTYEFEGSKAGFGLFRINPIWTIHMCKFGILRKFQGKGLARVFLSESLNNWRERGFKRCSVFVNPANQVAIRSYESVGFRPIEFLTTQIYMEKQL